MRRSLFHIAVLLVTVILFFTMAGNAQGYEAHGTQVVKEGGFTNWNIEASGANSVLNVSIEVTSGPNVNVVLVDAVNATNFLSGRSASFVVNGTAFNVSSLTRSVDLPAGSYHLVVYNGDYGNVSGRGDATIQYDIELSTDPSASPLVIPSWFIYIVAGIVLLLVIAVVAAVVRKK